ncbi:glycosyl hydrolase family 18 protein [Gorillibacterium massiliense]|uniref:glycosyl hydrolase family 18 protein n=1 Tax=Gorillibacterium massiliense TaxID=1280390 RepID=UPI0004AD02BF|nr:glycosyl hydrolase family 18 protein [Gorillibacterium massiliense]
MKRKILTAFIIVILAASLFPRQISFGKENGNFKVMGYFTESAYLNDPIDEAVHFDGLTHLIYGFLKPASDGSLYPIGQPERLKELVDKSHAHGVNVVIAVGGVFYGTEPLSGHFEALAGNDETIRRFVREVRDFVETYNLDGVEIDWEYPDAESSAEFERLILALKDVLSPMGKTLSAAVAAAGSVNTKAESVQSVTDIALENLNWINIMAYDLAGGQHSPYWLADASIQYWKKRGASEDQIVVGIPLYARPSWKQYRHLVALDKENAYLDFVPGDKLDSYYNGLNTIRQKTRLALNKGGGIMFFDIQEDTRDETSGLNAALDMIRRCEQYNLNDYFILVDNRELLYTPEEKLGMPYQDGQNRIQIPVRKALEAIGAKIEYDQASQTVTANRGETTVKIHIGSEILEVNGNKKTMDTKAVVKDDRTYLPLRWVYESFGYKVTWSESSKTVLVSKN